MKIKQLGIVSGVALATLVTASAAQAALLVVPPGLNPGDQYRLVFLTAGARDALSTNINDYNNFVTNQVTGSALANALSGAGLTTTWKAIGSTASVAARDNTGTNPSSTGVPIYLINGNKVANNNADLWDGSIQTAINRTQNDSLSLQGVFTGTSNDGTAFGNAGLGALNVVWGVNWGFANTTWIEYDQANGSTSQFFYGMSGVLTVPQPPQPVTVPEPSSLLGFITLGGLMLGGAVRKARK
ncbi:PEP-CTERM sorting domain-containing protein [Microcystis aeruginosa]|uniref:PEP-CTERM protein-sorting domain-containing protein n=1 Tax=Microcystis aeruginosa NIES-3807 TaxID=2517785 RepID=A0AAD3AZQ1_MICAE|nr:PEP-CTERM sorting domain-containing protein [Microcystis aeruginosa]GCL58516.1 hypothetical protein NIES3807_16830 [Microcystis aeruginosa NIES-3807]